MWSSQIISFLWRISSVRQVKGFLSHWKEVTEKQFSSGYWISFHHEDHLENSNLGPAQCQVSCSPCVLKMRAQATDTFLNKKWSALEAVKKEMTKNQEHILIHKFLTWKGKKQSTHVSSSVSCVCVWFHMNNWDRLRNADNFSYSSKCFIFLFWLLWPPDVLCL